MPSSVIRSFDYDPRAGRLAITFMSGRIYLYRDVPPMIYAAFIRARSKGAFFNTFIRNHYAFERLADASAA